MTKYKESTDNIYSVPDNNPRKSFDELYEEYSAMSIPEQLNNLKRLGRELVTKIDKIKVATKDVLILYIQYNWGITTLHVIILA